jgi:ribonuclease HI
VLLRGGSGRDSFCTLTLPSHWNRDTISDCFQLWVNQKSPPVCLAAHVCWQLWLERNRVTFEDRPPNLTIRCPQSSALISLESSTGCFHIHKAVDINLPEGYTLACFDGAEQSGCCGAGGFFKSNHSRITKWFFSCGGGTNTKAELLGLWTTLFLATSWSVKHLLVLGDSSVVIDWINCKSKLRSVHIECWKQKLWCCPSSLLTSNFNTFREPTIVRRTHSLREHSRRR